MLYSCTARMATVGVKGLTSQVRFELTGVSFLYLLYTMLFIHFIVQLRFVSCFY